jgi:hypothetical protein
MAYPDYDKNYVLNVDASQGGLGEIMYQLHEKGKLAVIAYGSRI